MDRGIAENKELEGQFRNLSLSDDGKRRKKREDRRSSSVEKRKAEAKTKREKPRRGRGRGRSKANESMMSPIPGSHEQRMKARRPEGFRRRADQGDSFHAYISKKRVNRTSTSSSVQETSLTESGEEDSLEEEDGEDEIEFSTEEEDENDEGDKVQKVFSEIDSTFHEVDSPQTEKRSSAQKASNRSYLGAGTSSSGSRGSKRDGDKKRGHASRGKSDDRKEKTRVIFSPHLSPNQIKLGIENGQYSQAVLRANPFRSNLCYVAVDGFAVDVIISGVENRNRSFDGDTVAIEILPFTDWERKKKLNRVRIPALNMYEMTEAFSAAESDTLSDTASDSRSEASFSSDLRRQPDYDAFSEDEKSCSDASSVCSDVIEYKAEALTSTPLSSIDSSPLPGSGVSYHADVETSGGDFSSSRYPRSKARSSDRTDDSPLRPSKLEENFTDTFVSESLFSRSLTLDEAREIYQNCRANEEFEFRPTGRVVGIVASNHRNQLVGFLRSPRDGLKSYHKYGRFVPVDKRYPIINFSIGDLPDDYFKRPEFYDAQIWRLDLKSWENEDPRGVLVEHIGPGGDIDAETRAILEEHGCAYPDFSEEAYDCLKEFESGCLPDGSWKIPEEERTYRRDFTKKLIFPIDPPTARDLDDALHIEDLGNGFFEIGVHIADVSHFIRAGSALDEEAALRSTTVYMVHRAFTMLPRLLTEQLCSLNAHVERLAFSCVFIMSEHGELADPTVYPPWFGRSIIRPCCRLNYDHAQKMIEGEITSTSYPDEIVPSGGYTPKDVVDAVLMLHRIAVDRRAWRFEHGSIQLQRPKIGFNLDPITKEPSGIHVYVTREANHLVEEYMLLANMHVAEFISSSCECGALLRRHVGMKEERMEEFISFAQSLGISISASDSKTFFDSLMTSADSLRERFGESGPIVLKFIASTCMFPAEYFNTQDLPDPTDWSHFALNFQHYTHFTSPIRRYPDIIVHRLLQYALDLQSASSSSVSPSLDKLSLLPITSENLSKVCAHANEKKMDAKRAQEHSTELFLWSLTKGEPFIREFLVVERKADRLRLVSPELGLTARIYLKDARSIRSFSCEDENHFYCPLRLEWDDGHVQEIRVFDKLTLQVAPRPAHLPIQLQYSIVRNHPLSAVEDQSSQ